MGIFPSQKGSQTSIGKDHLLNKRSTFYYLARDWGRCVCVYVCAWDTFVKNFHFSKELGKMPLKSHSTGIFLYFLLFYFESGKSQGSDLQLGLT